jgi:hypothetical protein
MPSPSKKLIGRITGVAVAIALAAGQAGTAVAADDLPSLAPPVDAGVFAVEVAAVPALADLPAGTVVGEFGHGS